MYLYNWMLYNNEKEQKILLSFSVVWGPSKNVTVYKSASSEIESDACWSWTPQPLELGENKCLLVKQLVSCILLGQHEKNRTYFGLEGEDAAVTTKIVELAL